MGAKSEFGELTFSEPLKFRLSKHQRDVINIFIYKQSDARLALADQNECRD